MGSTALETLVSIACLLGRLPCEKSDWFAACPDHRAAKNQAVLRLYRGWAVTLRSQYSQLLPTEQQRNNPQFFRSSLLGSNTPSMSPPAWVCPSPTNPLQNKRVQVFWGHTRILCWGEPVPEPRAAHFTFLHGFIGQAVFLLQGSFPQVTSCGFRISAGDNPVSW